MVNVARTSRDWLSQKVLIPFTYMQQMARPSRRPVRSAFFEGMRFRRDGDLWDGSQRNGWVLERLRSVLRRAYCETVYYRELFDGIGFDPAVDFSFDDFSRLPVLEREDMHREGKKLISSAIPADSLKRDATGGSTGTPAVIWMGPEEQGWRESSGEYFMQRLHLPVGSRIGGLWGHNLDPVASDSLRERYYNFLTNSRYFDCFRLSPEIFERYHRELEQWRPACIVAYASALGNMAEFLLERGYRPNYPTRCLVTGAEKLLPRHRKLIEEAFGRPVHERYGGRDIGYVGFQLAPELSYDFDIDWANTLLEPETSEPESEILITKLHADGMPMIRYRVGDVARFPAGSKPGHPAYLVNEIVGRSIDRVWLPDGRWIHGIQFPHLLKDYPVREFLLHQRQDFSVELQLVPKSDFDEVSKRMIASTIQANLPGLLVNIRMVEQVPRTQANKWRFVVSDVKDMKEKEAKEMKGV
jgi:phenylacetate-coenzyme A ligase PaaK-like adenylate-forming protein